MAEKCDTHGKQHRNVNLTLWSLLGVGFALLVWHVWAYGPTLGGKAALENTPFWKLLGGEIWGLFTDGHGVFAELGDIWLYFFIGIVFAGYIRTYKFHIRLRKTLIKHGFISIFIASVIGVFSPLCSCGILATVIGLLSTGLPLAPAMALLISSPLMSPTAFFLTIGDLGSEWAVVRVLVAFAMGVFAGVLTHLIRHKGFDTETLFVDGSIPEGDFHDQDYGDERLRCTCREKFSNRVARKHPNKLIIFGAKTLEMSWMIGKYVLVGIFIGCIAERYIPRPVISSLFGSKNPFNILWITVGSIPIFLHQISASSILYHIKEALPGTMNKGAGLAFLIGGPVTAVPAMTLLWAMFKKRVFVLYMAISILGTVMFAYGFNAFVFIPNVDAGNPLLQGISSLPSGEASVLVKSHEYVHMVADPDDQGMIAMYNDIEGGSGLVFESSLVRFRNESFGKENNDKYIANLANWLEDTTSRNVHKKILVYNTYTDSGYGLSEFDSNIPKVLGGGYKITLIDRSTTPQLTLKTLQNYSQVWIINGGRHSQGVFGEQEIWDLQDYREIGGAILIAAGADSANASFAKDANQIAGKFGVVFSGSKRGVDVLPVSYTGSFFEAIANRLLPYYDTLRRMRESEEREHES